MDKQAAVRLVKETFENPFDKARFTNLVKNLFKTLDTAGNFQWAGNRIPNAGAFMPHINSIERIGKSTVQDKSEDQIDVLIVNLKKETSLEYARTMQRNFVARYLDDKQRKAALVAFVPPDPADWRFSLMKMEYSLGETPTGRTKVEKELTPARRYSFLVGADESSHTAQIQLLDILRNDEKKPLLEDFEKAFNIEVVTKEFFTKYRELYYDVEEALRKLIQRDDKVNNEFTSKGIDTVNFAKKLLGQIVFLYFLQKKGWFGVGRDEEWGTGPKDFLRRLFEKKIVPYQNFFNDILEPLFYNTLALERPEDFSDRFNCKIPFLNGGLFDPINGYNWVHADILLPNELFSNQEMDGEDTGTGILDVFDRYNFTVKEDEPLDKEVAVDPEMLGKVFENLLEVKDRKSKGTYYTPREIVHYMCQESLINYLDTALNTGAVPLVKEKPANLKLFGAPAFQQQALKTTGNTNNIPREDIETFIRTGETAIEHDTRVETSGKETRDYSYKTPLSIRLNANVIDKALADIRVCDPAIGSGAFPVGLMTEIVRARNTLTTYLPPDKERTNYHFKRHAIQNCLYGVDIDHGAVEIAKLRLWLSLVVDEEDIKQIQPLPNLDYKIVCGNSLLGVEKDVLNWHIFEEIEKLKQEHFDETNINKKPELKKKIDQKINELTNNQQIFDFNIYFSEVFHEKGGFDVVIANPPYVSHDKLESKNELKKKYSAFEPFADLYCYFLELAVGLQNPNGIFCFITSNSYIKARYGKPLRSVLRKRTTLLELIDIEDYQVFDTAIVNTAVILARRGSWLDVQCIVVNARHDGMEFSSFVKKNTKYYTQNDFIVEPWSLASRDKLQIINKIIAAGKTLEDHNVKIRLGIATGANEAFLLDEETKSRLIQKDSRNSEIIKPVLRGRDIYRYGYSLDKQYVLLTKNGINVHRDYPTIYTYLEKFGDDFKNRGAQGNHWTNLRNCAFYDDFKKEKIVWIELTDEARFALCDEEIYLLNSAYFLLPPLKFPAKYLLGILNSQLIQFYLSMIAQTSGMGVTRWINEHVKKFPVPEPQKPISDDIIKKVTNILEITKDKDYPGNHEKEARVKELEHQINQLVYELYGLTPEEIAVVEGKK
jgi:hypothetical protein